MRSTASEETPLRSRDPNRHEYNTLLSNREVDHSGRDLHIIRRLQYPLSENGENIVAAEERLVRKLDRRIMPIACLLLLFAYLDRTNLGNARLQGLPEDILGGDPSGVLFDWLNSVFFVPYLLCQVPASMLAKVFPPRVWVGCAAIGWGLASTSMAFGFNYPSVMIARVFLGVFEAGFAPGIPLYLSLWYTKHEMGVRLAYWFGFAAVAGAFGGLIAYSVQHIHIGIASWRVLFVVEGIPSVMIGVFAMILLPGRPDQTSFLNEDERKIQVRRQSQGPKPDIGRTLNRTHVVAAFKDWKIYVAGAIYFGANCALASMSAFLPTIIKTFGYPSALAQLLTVPPYAVCAVVLLLASSASDRMQSRGVYVSCAAGVGSIGYLLLLTVTDSNQLRYFATFCVISGTYTVIGIVIAWFSHNLGSETKKATGIPIFMAIGQCGSILGSHLFPATDGPRYARGFAISCALEFLAAACGLILTIYYRRENQSRDREYGVPERDVEVDTSVLADEAPMFRYVP